MPRATITSKGQMTVPKEVREALKLQPGDQVDLIIQDEGDVIMRPANLDLEDLEGFLYRPGQRAVSVEEMNEAIRNYPRL
jgi:antitoxin PrlF